VATPFRDIVLPCPSDPRASVVVLAYRETEGLLRCLTSLEQRVGATVPFETIVVVNGASEDVVQALQRYVSGAVIVEPPVNLGFPGGCNRGRAAARGEYIVLLNDDAEAEPGWLEHLVATADANPAAGAVGGRILYRDGAVLQEAGSIIWSDGRTWGVGRGLPADDPRYDYLRRVDYCSGASLLVRARAWDAAGGMDEEYYPAYFEDADLCLAILRTGRQVLYEPRSIVRHPLPDRPPELFASFLYERNLLRFRGKWERELARREPWSDDPGAVDRAVHRARNFPRRLLIVDDQVPTAVGSGFGRMLDAIREMSALDFAIAMYPCNRTNDEVGTLVEFGVEIVGEAIESHLARPHVLYDAILVSRPHNFARFESLIRQEQPQAALIYDSEALFHQRLARQLPYAADDAERARIATEIETMRDLELSIPRRADRVVTLSQPEAAQLRSVEGSCPVDVVPVRMRETPWTETTFWERRDAIYTASWLAGPDSPNADGLVWFCDEVLPYVLEDMPWFRLRVTGGNPPARIRRLSGPHVELLGHVRDLRAVYASARAAIIPLRFGAGVKIKSLEAIRSGVPIVATRIGAEGIEAPSVVLEATDDAEQFASRILALLRDPAVFEEQRALLREVVRAWDGEDTSGAQTTWPSVVRAAQLGRSHERFALLA
jgi:O-antigen biosynthesis protein